MALYAMESEVEGVDEREDGTGSLLEQIWRSLKNREVVARGGSSSDSSSGSSAASAAVSSVESAVVASMDSMCGSAFEWARNTDGYNPCQLARLHADVCRGSTNPYPLKPLADGEYHYPTPTPQQASMCTCSIPVYNLIQACAACQLPLPSGDTTPYAHWIQNCSYAPTPPALFPYTSPSPLPAWSLMNPWSSGGSINLTVAFYTVSGGSGADEINFSSRYSQPLPYYTTSHSSVSPPQTASATTASSAASAASGSPPPPVMADGHQGHGGAPKPSSHMGVIIAAVVVTAVGLGILAGVITWLRRKRRVRRQGTRLGSTTDLHDPKPDGGPGNFPEMREKRTTREGLSDDYSLFVPTESFLSSSSARSDMSRPASFTTTNSSSSQSHDYRAFLVNTATDGSSSHFNSSFTGTSTSETISSSSRSSTNESRDSLSVNLEADDLSLSPFADIHRAPSRNSRVTMSSSSSSSYPIPPTSAAILPPPLRRPQHAAYLANQRLSVATMASLTPSSTASSRAAPSSTGAVYGRDDDASSFDSRRE